MNFHILTLFPEMIENGLNTSITGRAIKQNKMSLDTVDIREFTDNKHNRVDDYTYGGGAGMLMQAQPVFDAHKSVTDKKGKKIRTIYVTPQGPTFTQRMAEDFAKEEDLIILCGHYEGIDDRVLEEVVTDYVSIGDYVLTGGELAAMVMVDAISRLIPGVLNNDMSAETESFQGYLLEYPQYSRPKTWHDKDVPDVLLSGNQREINKWRLEESKRRTKERRPDLYEKYVELETWKERLLKQKLLHIDMIELINRNRAQLVYGDENELIIKDSASGVCFQTWFGREYLGVLNEDFINENKMSDIVLHQKEVKELLQQTTSFKLEHEALNSVYTQREKMSVTGLYRPDGKPAPNGLVIRTANIAEKELILEMYNPYEEGYLEERIKSGNLFIGLIDNKIVGMIGIHNEGSIGMLFVEPKYRGSKIGKALETYAVNATLEMGQIPYGYVDFDNDVSKSLQTQLGMYLSKSATFWMKKYLHSAMDSDIVSML